MPTRKKSTAKPKASAKPKVVKKAKESPQPFPEVEIAPEPDLVEEEVPELASEPTNGGNEITITVSEAEPLPQPSFEELMAAAWNTVKGPDDADFAHCDPSFLTDLAYHAKDV